MGRALAGLLFRFIRTGRTAKIIDLGECGTGDKNEAHGAKPRHSSMQHMSCLDGPNLEALQGLPRDSALDKGVSKWVFGNRRLN
jgi:hypothetical protein